MNLIEYVESKHPADYRLVPAVEGVYINTYSYGDKSDYYVHFSSRIFLFGEGFAYHYGVNTASIQEFVEYFDRWNRPPRNHFINRHLPALASRANLKLSDVEYWDLI